MKFHPVQNTHKYRTEPLQVPAAVAMKAYEVYSKVYSPQESLITGNCRGGFGVGELIAYLYASSFPQEEWDGRVEEAFNGMKV
jgi:hypothetical protein